MTDEQYLKLGKYIITNLEKLMSGEHLGRAVVCPIQTPSGEGMCRLTIDMPSVVEWITVHGKEGSFKREPVHFTWVPAEQAYVNDEYVYEVKKSKNKTN